MCTELGGDGMIRRRLLSELGTEKEEMKDWKLIRTITIPDSVTEERDGIVFSEQYNGGFLFGFDSDDAGEPFSITDFFCVYNAGTSKEVAVTHSLRIRTDTKIPEYGSGKVIYVPGQFGKSGSKTYGWFRAESILNNFITYGAYNTGTDFPSQLAIRGVQIISVPITMMSCFLSNHQGYGFESGSTFEIYGR